MANATRSNACPIFLVLIFTSAVSGCVSGYVEGTEDYIKFCIERQPLPTPSKCPKRGPSDGMVDAFAVGKEGVILLSPAN